MLSFDRSVFRDINLGLSSPFLDLVMLALSTSGLGLLQFLLCLGFLASPQTRKFVAPLLTVICFAGLVVAQSIKQAIPRDRPSNLIFAHVQENIHYSSFPSGHTTTSFAVATMLFLLLRRTRFSWVGGLAFLWAAMVGFSRIYRGVHWPSDVLAGVCAGVFSACLVFLCFRAFGADPSA